MKILIVSYLFAPNNEIGAIRPTKIAKYLSKQGITIDVISYGLKENNTLEVPKNIRNHYFMSTQPSCNKTKKTNTSKVKKDSRILKEIKHIYRDFLEIKKAMGFLKYCVRTFKGINEHYDYLLTSYGPLSSILCGLKIKKISPSIRWICDFRDPIITKETSVVFKPLFSALQRKSCKKADKITTVSEGFLRRICKNKFLEKRKCIPNGYDRDDLDIYSEPKKGCLIFSYAGSLYEGQRTFSPLFTALEDLIKQNLIRKEKIQFHYAGTDFAYLINEAKKYNLSDILVNHSRLDRKDCLKMESESHILVLSTWNSKKEQGVLPGKFLEYLLFNRPILCIVDGDTKNSEISTIIKKGNLGYSFEVSQYDVQYSCLTSFILKNYNIVTNHLKNDYNPVMDVVNYFSYDNIVNLLNDFVFKEKEK